MAIYHAHVSSGSRSGGQSGAAKVAYILRQGKYAKRCDLVVSGYGNLPAWAADDPCALFKAADLYERKNGRLFVEVEVALPNELSESQQHELVRAIAAAVTARGLPFTYSIHAGRQKSPGEPANPHAHILISERVNDGIPRSPELWFRRANRKNPGTGGAAKDRRMKEVSWVEDTRKVIEDLINEHLERARVAERVTADSHATRIEKALAAGDIKTVEYLRQHPPGKHVGPTVAALERDRFRQKKGEEPTLSRAGKPTDRGERHRSIAADAERVVAEMEATAEALGHARGELRRGEEAVDAARSAGLADDEILRIYETSESAEAGAGWASVEAAVAVQVERQVAAETAAGKFPIDVEGLLRRARDRGADPVSVLEEATAAFAASRTALLPDAEVWRIHDAAEFSEQGTGWTVVKAAAASREARKETAEAGAVTCGLGVDGVYTGALKRGADPVVELARLVVEREREEAERRQDEARRRVEDLESAIRVTKQGPAVMAAASRSMLADANRELTLEERERIAQAVDLRIRADLDRRKETLAGSEAGAWFLEKAQEDLRQKPGGRAAPSTLAAAEQLVDDVEQRLREYEAAEEQRAARRQSLFERPGAEDLYFAVLTGLDPGWRASGRTAVAHIDKALKMTASDSVRLGRLQDVLANQAAAACYRAALKERGDRFTVEDIDGAVGTALARRAAEAARQREEEEKRERKVKARRKALFEALSPAGRALHAAWLSPALEPSGADVDRALEATASDARLPRLEAVFGDAEQRSYYRAVLGAAGDAVTLQQVDEALAATGTFVRRQQDIFAYPGKSEHPAGGALYAAAVESRAPGWQPGADVGTAAVFDDALADVKSRLAKRVRQAADEFEKLLPTTPRTRRGYRVPALSDALVDQLAASRGDAFIQATVAEVRERYAHRARHGARDEDRYGPKERLESERAHLADVIEMTWDREKRLWHASGSRPTRKSVLARALKKYVSKVWEFCRVACDKVLGGDLGERLRRRREQVEQAAEVAERLLPTTKSSRRGLPVPAAYEEALAGVVTDGKNREVIEEMVEAVWERFHRRSRHEPYEQRYDADDRRRSEEAYLAPALEITRARQERAWRRSSLPSPRPTLASARPSVLEEHQSHLREIFEVAYDEVFGRGELGARWRRERDQVRRAVDAAEDGLSATQPPSGHPDRRVPALSDDALDELDAAETDPFLKKMYSFAWERCYRHASADTPYEQRYDADDRRRSELAHLDEVITRTYDRQMESCLSSSTVSPAPELASVRESVLKDYRAKVRGIFVAARDEVLRHDELLERQREQSVRPGRAATDPPSQSPSPGQGRKPPGGEQEERGRQERTGQDSTTGRSGKDDQDERWRAAAAPAAQPTAVTEANRVRLAAHRWAAKLPRTKPYAASPSHCPSVITDERFNRLAAAAAGGDGFVRKVIAAVQKKENHYHDLARSSSEREHLLSAVGRKQKEALDEYKKAEAERGIFSRRLPKPTRAEAEAAAIKEFEAEQLGVIEEVCREVQQLTPAAVWFELQRVEPGRMNTPSPSRSRGRTTNQRDRGDSGPSR